MILALIILSGVVAVAIAILQQLHFLHMLQLDSYSNARLWKWVSASIYRALEPWSGAAILLGAGVVAIMPPGAAWIMVGVWIAVGIVIAVQKFANRPQQKKPLKFTGRASRILAVGILLLVALSVAGTAVSMSVVHDPRQVAWIVLATAVTITQAGVIITMLANGILAPVQRAINATYVTRARKRLASVSPITVGITGSYGKTSTKYFTETILAKRFRVLKTPESYNTLLGISRVLNGELEEFHEVFIAEMGAYRPGDIRELARLVRPRIGVLTAVGPQHLERFGSIENIRRTKYELIEELPKDGTGIFNADDPICRELGLATTRVRTLLYGISSTDVDVAARHMAHGPTGLRFEMVRRNGESAEVQTQVLGRHNVSNILAAACVALELGISLADIARYAGRLVPAPHRLALVKGGDGITILDDSYNSNPIGARNALEVLGEFRAGKRILMTPGMVELGSEEDTANEELGRLAATQCDWVVLVGARRTRPIKSGLAQGGLAEDRTIVVESLAEGREAIRRIAGPGDTLLIENDLPDLYDGRK